MNYSQEPTRSLINHIKAIAVGLRYGTKNDSHKKLEQIAEELEKRLPEFTKYI